MADYLAVPAVSATSGSCMVDPALLVARYSQPSQVGR